MAEELSVQVKYWIGDKSGQPTETKRLDGSTIEPARMGLPENVTASKVNPLFVCWTCSILSLSKAYPISLAVCLCQPQAGDYTYSGVHDQGVLPDMREGGPMAKLIACVQQAREANDEYLTKLIEAEKAEHRDKKAKIGDE